MIRSSLIVIVYFLSFYGIFKKLGFIVLILHDPGIVISVSLKHLVFKMKGMADKNFDLDFQN